MVKNKVIFGVDLSLNHWAVCEIDYETGDCLDYQFLTNTKSEQKKDPEHGIFLPSKDTKEGENAENYSERRRAFSIIKLQNYFCEQEKNRRVSGSYVSLEGYAYSAMTRSITQIAEVTGCLKTWLWLDNYKIRIHDPLTIKLFASGKGNCLKKRIVNEAMDLGLYFPKELIKIKKKKGKGKKIPYVNSTLRKGDNSIFAGDRFEKQTIEEYDGAATDISDAFFLGRILRLELMLREGIIELKDLNESERKIFLRVTKAYPENILDRPFIFMNDYDITEM